MKTENKNSEKDLNANPQSNLNTNRTTEERERFPESRQARDEMEQQQRREQRPKKKKDASNIESLADEVQGTVGDRRTGSSPDEIAGVNDLNRGLGRRPRKP